MQKSLRSLALAATLTLALVPSVFANQTGCNPHPQVAVIAPPSSVSIVVYTVLSYLGA